MLLGFRVFLFMCMCVDAWMRAKRVHSFVCMYRYMYIRVGEYEYVCEEWDIYECVCVSVLWVNMCVVW